MLVSHAFARQCQILSQVRLASSFAHTLRRPQAHPPKSPTELFAARRSIFQLLDSLFSSSTKRPKRGRKPKEDSKDIDDGEEVKRSRRKRKVASADDTEKTIKAAKAKTQPALPPRLKTAKTAKHWDCKSYKEWAEKNGTDPNSTVYRGNMYEYRVAATLEKYGFHLERSGGVGDAGIDWSGIWHLPGEPEIKVLIQCKRSKPSPRMVRELHARGGAPAGWKTDQTISFLVASEPATKGVWTALNNSDLPLCFIQMSPEGRVKAFQWNRVAEKFRLTGLEATTLYTKMSKHNRSCSEEVQREVLLSWQKKPLGN